MSNLFNTDFRDFLIALNKHDVDYLLIGGYTVILYGYPRTTGDLDIWLKNSNENRLKLLNACLEFGLYTADLTQDKFENPEICLFHQRQQFRGGPFVHVGTAWKFRKLI